LQKLPVLIGENCLVLEAAKAQTDTAGTRVNPERVAGQILDQIT